MISIRTDLAIEARDMYTQENKRELDGVIVKEEQDEDVKITTVTIESDEAGKELGKSKGNYITIDFPEMTYYETEIMDKVSHALKKSLSDLIDAPHDKLALVVGLGNRRVTPDSLGPKVTEKIMVTRHIKQLMPEAIDESVRPVSCIAPGVLGVTGIETGEIVKSLAEKLKPDIVICIDALGSRKLERVNRTIQISDTGIAPGAGVGNNRMKINEDFIGAKVIGIGVPTVVHAATIANDALDLLLDELIKKSEEGTDFYKMLNSLDRNEKNNLIREILDPSIGDLMVTPKDVDIIMDSLSKVIANGINMAIQPNLDMEDINAFMS